MTLRPLDPAELARDRVKLEAEGNDFRDMPDHIAMVVIAVAKVIAVAREGWFGLDDFNSAFEQWREELGIDNRADATEEQCSELLDRIDAFVVGRVPQIRDRLARGRA